MTTGHHSDLSKESAIAGLIASGEIFDKIPDHYLPPLGASVDPRWKLVYRAARELRAAGAHVCAESVSDYIVANELDAEFQRTIDSTQTFAWRNWPDHCDASLALSQRGANYALEELGKLYRKREEAKIGGRLLSHYLSMKAPTPEPVTKFSERCDDPNGRGRWLGIARLTRIPDVGGPQRSACQKAVTAEEKSTGERIVAEYRDMERLAADNDVGAARARIRNPECTVFEAERIREKIRGMSEEKFNGTQSRQNELRGEAVKLVRPIFERLVEEFAKELNAVALQRESELQAMGIPLYSDRLDSAGYPCREFPVHADPIVTGWQCPA